MLLFDVSVQSTRTMDCKEKPWLDKSVQAKSSDQKYGGNAFQKVLSEPLNKVRRENETHKFDKISS